MFFPPSSYYSLVALTCSVDLCGLFTRHPSHLPYNIHSSNALSHCFLHLSFHPSCFTPSTFSFSLSLHYSFLSLLSGLVSCFPFPLCLSYFPPDFFFILLPSHRLTLYSLSYSSLSLSSLYFLFSQFSPFLLLLSSPLLC